MLITKIQRSRRERNRYDVYIGENPVLRMSDTLLVRWGLSVGIEIDEATFEKILAAEKRESAYQQALHFVSYRPRSSKEVLDKLARKSFDRDVALQVVDLLKDQHYLNDIEFARMYVRDRLKGKPMGRSLLRKKLMEKGLSFQISDRVLKEYLTDEDEEAAAKTLLTRKLRASATRFSKLDTLTRQKRLMEYLVQRGFSFEIAAKTARSLNR
jgi:regulatory protein